MDKKRPKNLNLFTIHFPMPAIVSILHRVSGIFIFLFIPCLLWLLNTSLASQQDFDALTLMLSSPLAKFLIWSMLSAFAFHLVAGIRHLLMDVGVGEDLKTARYMSVLTFIISALLIILMGIWIW